MNWADMRRRGRQVPGVGMVREVMEAQLRAAGVGRVRMGGDEPPPAPEDDIRGFFRGLREASVGAFMELGRRTYEDPRIMDYLWASAAREVWKPLAERAGEAIGGMMGERAGRRLIEQGWQAVDEPLTVGSEAPLPPGYGPVNRGVMRGAGGLLRGLGQAIQSIAPLDLIPYGREWLRQTMPEYAPMFGDEGEEVTA